MVNKRRWRYIPPERRLAETLKAADRATRDAQAPTGTEREQAVRVLKEEVSFLINQVAYGEGPAVARRRTENVATSDPEFVWAAFAPASDVSLVVVATQSGAAIVEVGAFCRAEAGGRITSADTVTISAQALLGFEVLGPGGALVLGPDPSRAATTFVQSAVYLSAPSRIANSTSSSYRFTVSGLIPGATYTFRTRMGSRFRHEDATYSFSLQDALINSPRLSVTNIR